MPLADVIHQQQSCLTPLQACCPPSVIDPLRLQVHLSSYSVAWAGFQMVIDLEGFTAP